MPEAEHEPTSWIGRDAVARYGNRRNVSPPGLSADGVGVDVVRQPADQIGAGIAVMQVHQLSDLLLCSLFQYDLFGVDFEVDRESRVVLFEATAAMTLHPTAKQPLDVQLPREPYLRVDDAFRNLVVRRIAEGPRRLT